MSRKALVVGIDDYPCMPLNGCVNDATDMKDLLETNGDGSPNFEVKFAPNIQTKSELLDNLNALFCEGDSDISLFYFSGHGADENTGSIVTPDFKGFDLGVSMSDILTLMNKSKSNNKIAILDCCFSGRLGEIGSISSKATIIGEGVTIMTASSRDQFAEESGTPAHGVFTKL